MDEGVDIGICARARLDFRALALNVLNPSLMISMAVIAALLVVAIVFVLAAL
jgi:hypothetical protein